MADAPELLIERDGHVSVITLNRPERLNTISGRMLGALSKALVEADRDRDVRVIILTGAGRAFCAGLDLNDMSSGGGGLSGSGDSGGGGGAPGELDMRDAPPNVLHNLDTPV